MEKKLTQEERVLERLLNQGYVDNFWAIQNFMLRLAAIIHLLKKAGWKIEGATGVELGFEKRYEKNYYYFIAGNPPKQHKEQEVLPLDIP